MLWRTNNIISIVSNSFTIVWWLWSLWTNIWSSRFNQWTISCHTIWLNSKFSARVIMVGQLSLQIGCTNRLQEGGLSSHVGSLYLQALFLLIIFCKIWSCPHASRRRAETKLVEIGFNYITCIWLQLEVMYTQIHKPHP